MRFYVSVFIFIGVVMLVVGTFLLYQAFSDLSHDQFFGLISGAALASLGAFCIFFEGRFFFRWLQDSKVHSARR